MRRGSPLASSARTCVFQVFKPIQDALNLKPADSAGRRRVGRGVRGPDDLFAKVMLGQVLKARNAPELTHADIETLTQWADGGAVEGNAADKPTGHCNGRTAGAFSLTSWFRCRGLTR